MSKRSPEEIREDITKLQSIIKNKGESYQKMAEQRKQEMISLGEKMKLLSDEYKEACKS